MSTKIVAISGYFDPIHPGHIRYIREASKLGDKLVVILNTDNQLINNKGFVFMQFKEREEVLNAIKGVDLVLECLDTDGSVCKSIAALKPNIFAKGGDRIISNIPEVKVCEDNKIQLVFGVGGNDKPESSSWLVESLIKQIKNSKMLKEKYGIN